MNTGVGGSQKPDGVYVERLEFGGFRQVKTQWRDEDEWRDDLSNLPLVVMQNRVGVTFRGNTLFSAKGPVLIAETICTEQTKNANKLWNKSN